MLSPNLILMIIVAIGMIYTLSLLYSGKHYLKTSSPFSSEEEKKLYKYTNKKWNELYLRVKNIVRSKCFRKYENGFYEYDWKTLFNLLKDDYVGVYDGETLVNFCCNITEHRAYIVNYIDFATFLENGLEKQIEKLEAQMHLYEKQRTMNPKKVQELARVKELLQNLNVDAPNNTLVIPLSTIYDPNTDKLVMPTNLNNIN